MRCTKTALFVIRAFTLLSIVLIVKVNGQIDISAGYSHTCAFERTSAEMKCWGAGGYYQLNTGNQSNRWSPIGVSLFQANIDVKEGRAGGWGVCMASKDTGSVSCTGRNDRGQLGTGSTPEFVKTPTAMVLPANTIKITQIVLGSDNTCLISDQKELLCTGNNDSGQLGVGSTSTRIYDEVTPVNGGHRVEKVAVGGGFHICFISAAFALWCMGRNDYGQLGLGYRGSNVSTAKAVVGLEGRTVQDIACGNHHTCLITDLATVMCMGNNEFYGQLGIGINNVDYVHQPTPIVQQDGDAIAISAGGVHNCFIVISGKVFCFGSNFFGQIGNAVPSGHNNKSSVPVEVNMPSSATTPVDIALGESHSCVSTASNQVYCWGQNTAGQLGRGSASPYEPIPKLVQAINWPAPTASPTITQAGNNQWFIDNTGNATVEATSADTILISLPMNVTNKDLGALVFEEDCITPFDSSNYFSADTTPKTSNQPDGFVQFNSTLAMNITAINGTKYWHDFTDGARGGWVEACVETYLSFTDAFNLGNDDTVQKVVFKNNVLNISVSLNVDYEVDKIKVERETADRQDVNTDYSEFIIAYECLESNPYSSKTSSDPYNQGDEITICVKDDSGGIVQVEEFVDLAVTQHGTTPYNFILNGLFNPDITTPDCLEATASERRVCYAKIRALARFFQTADPGDLTISGSVYVVRDGGRRVRRNLRMALTATESIIEEDQHALAVSPGRHAEEEEEGSGEFEVRVSLGTADDSAASDCMIGSGVAGLMSMAVGAAGAALMA